MPTILPANSAIFGVSGSDTFQSKTVTTKMDKKEASDRNGEPIAWAFYGKMAEHKVEALGTVAATYELGVATLPAGITAVVGGTVFCVDELSVNNAGDDFAKSSISVSEYLIED